MRISINFLGFFFVVVPAATKAASKRTQSHKLSDGIPMALNSSQISQFNRDGFLVIDKFCSPDQCIQLKTRIRELTQNIPKDENQSIFTTDAERHTRDDYFLDSGDKIRYFWEEGAGGAHLNKVGHALHRLDRVFKRFSESEPITGIAKSLLPNPITVQSMYIFKSPRVGGFVNWHQDATFLFTNPNTTVGLWFALDDATKENGCLWAIPGGHLGPLRKRFVRTKDNKVDFIELDATPFSTDLAVPVEVSAGSLVLLHSHLPHMSEKNSSDQQRHAYTLHILDASSDYPPDNWLRWAQ